MPHPRHQKAWRESITQASAQATSAISAARDQAVQPIEKAAAAAGAVVTGRVADENDRAERIIAATAKLQARQLWDAAGAMALVLLPVATVVAGLWMSIAGLITGVQWALDVDGSVGSASAGGSWSPWALAGSVTASSCPSGGPRAWSRPGGAGDAEVARPEEVKMRWFLVE